jgi:hypothetical protein
LTVAAALGQHAQPTQREAQMTAGGGERTFLAAQGVMVTSARFVVAGQTYAVANITSVKYLPPQRGGGILLALLGVPALVVLPLGIGMILVGALVAALAQATVVLVTAGAEAQALKSRDTRFVQSVVQALNEAIISRG